MPPAQQLNKEPNDGPSWAKQGQAYDKMPGDFSSKKTQIVNRETGQVSNQTITSPAAPDWMKSPFTSNKEHFMKFGDLQELKNRKGDIGAASAGKARHETGIFSGYHDARRARRDVHDKDSGQAKFRTAISTEAPEFMRHPHDSHEASRQRFDQRGASQQVSVAKPLKKPGGSKELSGAKKGAGPSKAPPKSEPPKSEPQPSGRAASCASTRDTKQTQATVRTKASVTTRGSAESTARRSQSTPHRGSDTRSQSTFNTTVTTGGSAGKPPSSAGKSGNTQRAAERTLREAFVPPSRC